MLYTIHNDCLTAAVDDLGAQLWSIRSADGAEYLWQGDPTYWSDRALTILTWVRLSPRRSILSMTMVCRMTITMP